jgi:hypothetical protein
MGARAKELPHQSDLQDELSWSKSATGRTFFFFAAVTVVDVEGRRVVGYIWSSGRERITGGPLGRWAVGPLRASTRRALPSGSETYAAEEMSRRHAFHSLRLDQI